jgi:hypothetical protein
LSGEFLDKLSEYKVFKKDHHHGGGYEVGSDVRMTTPVPPRAVCLLAHTKHCADS